MTHLVLEAGAGLPADQPPAYARELHAGHTAHEPELRAAMAAVGFPPGGRVLDLACGDGCHLSWLRELVAEAVGVDRSPALLAEARARGPRVVLADAAALPLADASFDGAWCANSLSSLPDPDAALRELRRVVRPGGRVAVLETDLLHGLVLPWPPELELAVRVAQLQALGRVAAEAHRPLASFYSGRDLPRRLAAAGLAPEPRRTLAIDRRPPLGAADEAYLRSLLADLRWRAAPFLTPDDRRRLDALLTAGGPDDLLGQPHGSVTLIAFLAVATR